MNPLLQTASSPQPQRLHDAELDTLNDWFAKAEKKLQNTPYPPTLKSHPNNTLLAHQFMGRFGVTSAEQLNTVFLKSSLGSSLLTQIQQEIHAEKNDRIIRTRQAFEKQQLKRERLINLLMGLAHRRKMKADALNRVISEQIANQVENHQKTLKRKANEAKHPSLDPLAIEQQLRALQNISDTLDAEIKANQRTIEEEITRIETLEKELMQEIDIISEHVNVLTQMLDPANNHHLLRNNIDTLIQAPSLHPEEKETLQDLRKTIGQQDELLHILNLHSQFVHIHRIHRLKMTQQPNPLIIPSQVHEIRGLHIQQEGIKRYVHFIEQNSSEQLFYYSAEGYRVSTVQQATYFLDKSQKMVPDNGAIYLLHAEQNLSALKNQPEFHHTTKIVKDNQGRCYLLKGHETLSLLGKQRRDSARKDYLQFAEHNASSQEIFRCEHQIKFDAFQQEKQRSYDFCESYRQKNHVLIQQKNKIDYAISDQHVLLNQNQTPFTTTPTPFSTTPKPGSGSWQFMLKSMLKNPTPENIKKFREQMDKGTLQRLPAFERIETNLLQLEKMQLTRPIPQTLKKNLKKDMQELEHAFSNFKQK